MAYSDSFPSVRPSFMFSADAGRLDPRISYSRSTTGTYFGTDKHLSSENLLLQSSDFDTTWSNQALSGINSGQTDPSGGTDGFTLVENAAAAFHRVYQSVSATGELALTVYAKRNSGTRYLNLTIATSSSTTGAGLATFDLAGGAAHTDNGVSSTLTNLSATQTASGNGYYKCVFKATATGATYVNISLSDVATPVSNYYGLVYYTGDNSSSIDIAFASLTTTGATDYNATTTQIHREYAPTLQTAAINAPRFEHSATDSASMGLLVEGQATNLATYSEDFSNAAWVKARLSASTAAAVAPDGTLTANQLTTDGTAANTHSFYYDYTTGGATAQTVSFYAKAGTLNWLQIRFSTNNGAFADSWANYNLSTGAIGTIIGGVAASASSCGNGWYRIVATQTALTNATGRIVVYTQQSDNNRGYDGNSYDNLLIWGGQIEANQSFASSYIKSNSGSATTRAADSASAVTSDIGYTGGPLTVVGEASFSSPTSPAGGYDPRLFRLHKDSSNYAQSFRLYSDNTIRTQVFSDGAVVATFANAATSTVADTYYKFASRISGDNYGATLDGAAPATDTAGQLPDLNGATLYIGKSSTQGEINGHIKRLALYSEALSDTNLQALTS